MSRQSFSKNRNESKRRENMGEDRLSKLTTLIMDMDYRITSLMKLALETNEYMDKIHSLLDEIEKDG
jgi:hypothetical protein